MLISAVEVIEEKVTPDKLTHNISTAGNKETNSQLQCQKVLSPEYRKEDILKLLKYI